MLFRSSRTRYWSMLAGNTTWVPYTPTGSYESITTVTVGAGGSSTISFSSIPSTYQHLQVRFNGSITTSGGAMGIYFNSDSTSTNYYQHVVYGSGAGAAAAARESAVHAERHLLVDQARRRGVRADRRVVFPPGSGQREDPPLGHRRPCAFCRGARALLLRPVRAGRRCSLRVVSPPPVGHRGFLVPECPGLPPAPSCSG